jgi:hypothetical protein
MSMCIKVDVFCDIEPYSLVDIERRFRGTYCFHYYRPDDGGSKNFWTVRLFLRNIPEDSEWSSYSTLWEPEILQRVL